MHRPELTPSFLNRVAPSSRSPVAVAQMMTDHAAPDIARPRFVEEAAVIQDPPQPAAEEDRAPLPAMPSFAFAAWKAELELMLQRGTELVHESVQALQGDFDDRSQFVRGDFAWRKQVTAFHDRLQDVLTDQLGLLAERISKHAAHVSESLAQTLAKAERDGQRAVHQQEQKGELALRRARAALTKEVERIARLEKCLRLEEARQAAAILAERERQLTAEHDARESHLQALLGDMRSSNESLETLNSQLLEALRTSRTELDQLRNTLVRSISRSKRRGSVSSQGESKSAGVESAARGGGEKSGKNSTASLPSTANELLLVPSLRQSLSAATQSVTSLKSRVSELESARDSDKKRLQELQLALAQAENEKLKATQLLGEARSALIDNEGKLVEAANESVRWQDKFDRLQALAQGRERALADSQRLENATRDQLAVMTSRVERVAAIEARWRDFDHAVAKWKETQPGDQGEVLALKNEMDSTRRLEHIVESFLRLEGCDQSEATERQGSTETQKELEVRLRYEFERRFGEQLILRISHERRRVLERLERICAAEAKDKQEKGQRRRQSFSRVQHGLESDFTRLKRLVKAAYDQLGICVGAWAETDLDGLHARLSAFEVQVQALERDLEAAANRAEAQRVSLVRAELAQQEKGLLLAELTSRYQQLRTAQVAWDPQQQPLEQQGALQRQSIERKPLTVYGIPHPLTQKTRLHSLMQLPARTRPSSATPCLGSVEHPHHSFCRVPQSPPSRLDPHRSNKTWQLDLQKPGSEARVEEVEEHIRSMLKASLMDHANQLEDTVGSDGVLEILHRRRHRK